MYNQVLQNLIQLNFLPLVSLLFLFVFIVVNDRFEHELSRKFWPMLLLLLILVLFDIIDYYLFDIMSTGLLHVFTAFVGYNLRILILLSLVLVVMRDMSFNRKMIVHIPAVVNLLITSLAFFTKLVYWYGEDGSVRRGPLAYTPHIVMLVYLGFCLVLAIRYIMRGRQEEGIIVIIEVLLCILGTGVELLYALRGILIGVISLNITFYYLYIHISYFKMDVLTGAFNRTSFFADATKSDNSISAVYSIDLNNLKTINDTMGHQAGDEAIRTIANKISDVLPAHCSLYRVGGDEFCVLCMTGSKNVLHLFSQRLRDCQLTRKYTFAFGMHEWKDDFKTTYALADKAMYADKARIKDMLKKKEGNS